MPWLLSFCPSGTNHPTPNGRWASRLGVLSLTFLPLQPRIIRPEAPKVSLEIATRITAPTITGIDNIQYNGRAGTFGSGIVRVGIRYDHIWTLGFDPTELFRLFNQLIELGV